MKRTLSINGTCSADYLLDCTAYGRQFYRDTVSSCAKQRRSTAVSTVYKQRVNEITAMRR